MLEKYKCTKPFTWNGQKIQTGSIWDYSPYYMTKNGVKIYLSDSGSDDDKKTYLDLTEKMFNSYFERIV